MRVERIAACCDSHLTVRVAIIVLSRPAFFGLLALTLSDYVEHGLAIDEHLNLHGLILHWERSFPPAEAPRSIQHRTRA